MAIRKYKATVQRVPVEFEFEIDDDHVEINPDTIEEALWEAYDKQESDCVGIAMEFEEIGNKKGTRS